MAIREIRVTGDPVLRTPCDTIVDFDNSVRVLVQDLEQTVDADGRAGLAANQIGVSLRAFAWNIDEEIGHIINPQIVELSDETQDGDEGCLSVPGLWYPCERAWYARAEGFNVDGERIELEGEEIWARLIQHEVDHLDGKLYLDRLKRDVRKAAMRELRESLDQSHQHGAVRN
ncbi:MAG: peptide deformylase [Demequina sp.]